METDRKNLKKKKEEKITKKKFKIKKIKRYAWNLKFVYSIFIVLIFVLICSFLSFRFIRNKIGFNNEYKNINIINSLEKDKASNETDCLLVKNKLKNRTHPFDFANELIFFTELIACKIPFSFVRFADGENAILKGDKIDATLDRWHWNPSNKKFRESLIKATSNCVNDNNFVGIPCKNWIHISKSILSFSNCTSSKYMTFTTLFVNKNFEYFHDWIIRFVNSSNRWKIILVANKIINKNISWAYKFFPVPDHIVENFDNISISLLSELSNLAKQNN